MIDVGGIVKGVLFYGRLCHRSVIIDVVGIVKEVRIIVDVDEIIRGVSMMVDVDVIVAREVHIVMKVEILDYTLDQRWMVIV